MSAPRRIDHDRVLRLWAEGRSSGEIAARMGLAYPEAVRAIVRRARLRGDLRAAARMTPEPQLLILPQPLAERAALEAGRRRLELGEFCQRLIETCIRENLIEAVLDDAGGKAVREPQ